MPFVSASSTFLFFQGTGLETTTVAAFFGGGLTVTTAGRTVVLVVLVGLGRGAATLDGGFFELLAVASEAEEVAVAPREDSGRDEREDPTCEMGFVWRLDVFTGFLTGSLSIVIGFIFFRDPVSLDCSSTDRLVGRERAVCSDSPETGLSSSSTELFKMGLSNDNPRLNNSKTNLEVIRSTSAKAALAVVWNMGGERMTSGLVAGSTLRGLFTKFIKKNSDRYKLKLTLAK